MFSLSSSHQCYLYTSPKSFDGLCGLVSNHMHRTPTSKEVFQPINIKVIDMVRIKDGKYLEHWGLNTLPMILAQLSK